MANIGFCYGADDSQYAHLPAYSKAHLLTHPLAHEKSSKWRGAPLSFKKAGGTRHKQSFAIGQGPF